MHMGTNSALPADQHMFAPCFCLCADRSLLPPADAAITFPPLRHSSLLTGKASNTLRLSLSLRLLSLSPVLRCFPPLLFPADALSASPQLLVLTHVLLCRYVLFYPLLQHQRPSRHPGFYRQAQQAVWQGAQDLREHGRVPQNHPQTQKDRWAAKALSM